VIEIYPSGKPHEEVRWQEYVLDVGYLQDDGEVGFAAEVYVTHRIGDDKADALDIHDMPFVEVCAASVLESIETKTVHALRSNRVSCAECIHVNMTCEAKIYDEMHAASTDADAQATAASARDAKSKLDALIATSQQMRAVLDQSDANALARGHGLNVQELEAFMKARNVQMRAPTLRFFETKGDSLRRVDYGKYKGRFYDDVFSAHTVRADRVYMARVLAGVLSDGSDRIEYTYAPPPLHLKQRAREALADAHVCCRCLQDVCACAGS
jgi:ferredoxin-like protein FixX